MANGTLNSWAEVQALLSANSAGVAGAPHQAFWETLTYDQFINHCVPDPNGQSGGPPCITDQTPPPPPNGQTYRILIPKDSANSNIIKALKGEPPFDGSVFNQMPDGDTPWTADMVQSLADWIDNNCPQFAPAEAEEPAVGYK